jgi:tetratricopeptide (TPR) repeat protein
MPAATRLAKTRPIGSPLQAYRLDLSGRLANAPFSGNDGVWLTISELVAAHCAAGRESTATPVLRAIELAVQHLGSDAVAKGCRHDPVDRVGASAITPIRVIAEHVEHAGLLRVAAVLLDAVQAIADVDPLDRGRIAAQRARIARKLGDSEGAADRYTELEALAEDLNDDELRSRALLGRAAAAQVSGNYPETERLAAACVSLATSRGYLGLAAAARVGLVSCAAHRGDLDAALQHAWTSIGALHDNPVAEAEYTANLGRLLLDMGQTAAARSRTDDASVLSPILGRGFAHSYRAAAYS